MIYCCVLRCAEWAHSGLAGAPVMLIFAQGYDVQCRIAPGAAFVPRYCVSLRLGEVSVIQVPITMHESNRVLRMLV